MGPHDRPHRGLLGAARAARLVRAATLLLVLTPFSTIARGDLLCAFRTESGALVYSNTPQKNGACAGIADAPLAPPASPSTVSRYDQTVRTHGARYGVSTQLIHAVIASESAYNPGAVSPKGAKGLMQLMPSTAKRYGVTDIFDPDQNIRGGVAHLRDLLDAFGGDARLAVAAYNAGSQAVRRYSGIPPFRETRTYVARVMSRMGGRIEGIVRERSLAAASAPIEVRVDGSGAVSWVN